jgi:hypothetical protein
MTDLGYALLFGGAADRCAYILTNEPGIERLDVRVKELAATARTLPPEDRLEIVAVLGWTGPRARIARWRIPRSAVEDLIEFAMRLDGGAQ